MPGDVVMGHLRGVGHFIGRITHTYDNGTVAITCDAGHFLCFNAQQAAHLTTIEEVDAPVEYSKRGRCWSLISTAA